MQLADQVVVVTGGAHGIGRALCERFAREGPAAVVVADIEIEPARAVAEGIGATARRCDVSREEDIRALIEATVAEHGRIDLFCSNAGIGGLPGGAELDDATWNRVFAVNFWAHLWAARALLPIMLEQGRGYLLNTISAAGLLTSLGSAPYAVTKHAALALAEWIRITHGRRGIGVSCLCPQGVRTRMLLGENNERAGGLLVAGALEPAEVADIVVAGLADERFLILPHEEVAEFFRRKGTDYDRWLRGMERLLERSEQGYQLERP